MRHPLEVGQAWASDLGIIELQGSQVDQSLQMSQARVSDLRGGEVEIFQARQALQVGEVGVGDGHSPVDDGAF